LGAGKKSAKMQMSNGGLLKQIFVVVSKDNCAGTTGKPGTASGFFRESSSPKPLKITFGSFGFFLKNRGDIHKSKCTATGINDTVGKFATDVNDTGGK
jgi:hypothetical protein